MTASIPKEWEDTFTRAFMEPVKPADVYPGEMPGCSMEVSVRAGLAAVLPLIGTDILSALQYRWEHTPNVRTEDMLGAYRQNAIGPGMREAMDVIRAWARERGVDMGEA